MSAEENATIDQKICNESPKLLEVLGYKTLLEVLLVANFRSKAKLNRRKRQENINGMI